MKIKIIAYIFQCDFILEWGEYLVFELNHARMTRALSKNRGIRANPKNTM